jgi:hypothetical protein
MVAGLINESKEHTIEVHAERFDGDIAILPARQRVEKRPKRNARKI